MAERAPVRAADLTLEQQVALLSGQDVWHTRELPEAGVPSILLSDGPHGLRVQTGRTDHLGLSGSLPATCFPTAVTLASTWDPELLTEVGRALGAEARAQGVAVLLGPGLNIKRHPLGGRNFEYLSEDPLLAGRLAAAVVDGVQSQGVGCSAKHFAVNNQESHRFVVDAVVDERTLREIYLAAFEHVVRASDPWTVMCGYNSVNGESCSVNGRLLTRILREEWGYAGLVVSDWGATVDRGRAVAAGLDLEMPHSGLFDAAVRASVRSGELDAGHVERSAQRVLDLVARAGAAAATAAADEIEPAWDEHDHLARRAAAAGTVLLANDGVLPLYPASAGRTALIGAFAEQPRYQGAGSSRVNPHRVTSACEAFAARGIEVAYAPGYDPRTAEDDATLLAEAVEAARDAEVAVVVVGLPERYESEGFDRDDLALPAQHDALVRAVCAVNPRTVVVLQNGAPVALPWRDAPAAILECYLGGQAGGAALVDVLLGDREPGGRLAETFPMRREDVAADPWFPGHPRQVEHREGLFVGYRHAVAAGIEPAFAFGHGLSYTSFDWGVPRLDATTLRPGEGLTVTVPVANTGDRAGADVVQVYRHDRTGVVLRPRRELAGFAKVHLEPGESADVEVAIEGRALAYYDVDERDWRTPEGRYTLEIARSSVDVVHTIDVEVTGGVATAPDPVDTEPLAVSDEQFRARLRRPVPAPSPVRPFTRDSTLGEIGETRLGALLHRAAVRATPVDDSPDADESVARMVERSMAELPLRALAIFSDGRISLATLDLLLDLLNGRPGSAVRRAARGVARQAVRGVAGSARRTLRRGRRTPSST